MSPLTTASQLVNGLVAWMYAHSPTSNRYVLALAVAAAALVAARLLRRVAAWLLTAVVAAFAVMVAYRLLAG